MIQMDFGTTSIETLMLAERQRGNQHVTVRADFPDGAFVHGEVISHGPNFAVFRLDRLECMVRLKGASVRVADRCAETLTGGNLSSRVYRHRCEA